jgi:AraC-like DNA-binding protein
MEQKRSTTRLPERVQFARWRTVAPGANDLVSVARPGTRLAGGRGLGTLALVEDRAPTPCTAREQLFEAAVLGVEEMLGDPALAPGEVAKRIAISPRYLHRLFAERGTTFGRWLLERRLARGRDVLLDPAQADRAIGDIAYSVGFADPSYFARAFKARYGTTPRTARKTAFVELAVAA